MGREKRRHDRFPVALPVDLALGKNLVPGETVDVSFGGLLIRTEEPPPLRQLVKAKLRVPPDDHALSLMAMAVFVEGPRPDSGPRAVGLQLFGLDPETRERWEAFVKHVRAAQVASQTPDLVEPKRSLSDEDDFPWEDIRPELRIAVSTAGELEAILDQEIPRGRIYVRTDLHLESGREVDLHLVHPESDRTFKLRTRVDRRVVRPGFDGVRLTFGDLAASDLSALERFVHRGGVVTIDLGIEALGDARALEGSRGP